MVLASDAPGSAEHDAALPYPVVRRPTGDAPADAGGGPGGRGPRPPARVRQRVLRRRRTARAARARRCGRPACGTWSGPRTGTRPAGWRSRVRGSCCSASRATSTSSPTSASTRAAGSSPRWAGGRGWPSSRPGSTSTGSRPDADGAAVRRRYGLGEAPVVVCVSRLVARKGQDVLVAGWPRVLARHPGARLLLVGGGPAEASLRRAVAARGLADSVVLTGPVPPAELPGHYAAGDVFAMPCRTRRGRAGRRGPRHGLPRGGRLRPAGGGGDLRRRAGDGPGGRHRPRRRPARRPEAVADAVADLLADPARARAMGAAGRAWVEQRWSWTTIAAGFAELLEPGHATEPRPADAGRGSGRADQRAGYQRA